MLAKKTKKGDEAPMGRSSKAANDRQTILNALDDKASGVHQLDIGPSIIGAGLTFVGDLTNRADLNIEGTIEGEVNGGRVTVGGTGRIVGNIEADDVTIAGALIGTVYANSLTIAANGKVSGDIYCEQLAVEGGACVSGYCFAGRDFDSQSSPNNVYELRAAAE